MSLRELPPDQQLRRDRWRRLRYVPLVLLLVFAVVATVLGTLTQARLGERSALGDQPARPTAEPTADAGDDGPDADVATACPAAPIAARAEPWLDDPAGSEATWQANAGAMTEAWIQGADGFVDWGDIQALNLSQSVGRRLLTNDEVTVWVDYLGGLRDALAAEDIPLVIAITPAKWESLPQHLPEWTSTIRGSTPIDQLDARGAGLPLIDLRTVLRDEQETEPVYSRVNSHWTDYGAWVGWRAIAGCLDALAPELGGVAVPALDSVALGPTQNEFADFGVPDPEPDWTVPVLAEPQSEVELTAADGTVQTVAGGHRTGLEALPASTVTADALTPLSALVVRDSFSVSMSAYYEQTFARTWQIRHNFDRAVGPIPDIVAAAVEHDPDVVVLQIAGRHLTFPPTG